MEKEKYTTVEISGVITSIGVEDSKVKGYVKCILETFLPDENDKKEFKNEKQWIAQNNKRMEAICKFLNENNL